MVLRCDQTGKLFFSHREAEVHGEETGFQAFSQVSLEEKVWVCEETGKLCFNEQQMDLHKRRVPDAKTFNEKTIADVKAEQDAKASAGDGEMETEEDIVRREAGLKGGKKGAAAEPAGPPVITKESVDQLLDMGFSQLRAEKALVSTRAPTLGANPSPNPSPTLALTVALTLAATLALTLALTLSRPQP